MTTAIGPYSPAFRAGGFLFCSGQIGIEGGALVDGLGAQTTQAIVNLRQLLKENNAGLRNVVKTTVFLTDMDDFNEMNEIYSSLFGDHKPARSTVAVAALPKGARFEIEAVAYVD